MNSIITSYNIQKRISTAKVVDSRGEVVTLHSGCVWCKSVIIDFSKNLDKTIAIICANFFTHFAIDAQTSATTKEYSPIASIEIGGNAGSKSLFKIDQPIAIPFNLVHEFEFYLLKPNGFKIPDVKFQVHLFYKIC